MQDWMFDRRDEQALALFNWYNRCVPPEYRSTFAIHVLPVWVNVDGMDNWCVTCNVQGGDAHTFDTAQQVLDFLFDNALWSNPC